MKESTRNIIILILIAGCLLLLTKIQLLIIYLFISLVISITINPLSNWICNLSIYKHKIDKNIAAILCLLIICLFSSIFGYILSPLIIEEIQIISSIQIIEIQNFINIIAEQINKNFPTLNLDIEPNIIDVFNDKNISSITGVFQSMLGLVGNILRKSAFLAF